MGKNLKAEEELVFSFGQLDEECIISKVKLLLDEGYSSYELLELLNKGAAVVGDTFERGEYYIADLIASGVLYTHAMELLDLSSGKKGEDKGTVLIGVMRHDIHDIGKDIVCSVLESDGFRVVDLGVDVKNERFLEEASNVRPDVIALAGTLSFSTVEMGEVITALRSDESLRNIPIIIGGACTSDAIMEQVGADACPRTPMDTLHFCNATLGFINDKESK